LFNRGEPHLPAPEATAPLFVNKQRHRLSIVAVNYLL